MTLFLNGDVVFYGDVGVINNGGVGYYGDVGVDGGVGCYDDWAKTLSD